MYRHIAKIVQLGSNSDQCYIQNHVVMNHVIKRSRCIFSRTYFPGDNDLKFQLKQVQGYRKQSFRLTVW